MSVLDAHEHDSLRSTPPCQCHGVVVYQLVDMPIKKLSKYSISSLDPLFYSFRLALFGFNLGSLLLVVACFVVTAFVGSSSRLSSNPIWIIYGWETPHGFGWSTKIQKWLRSKSQSVTLVNIAVVWLVLLWLTSKPNRSNISSWFVWIGMQTVIKIETSD